jgi:hypothetical protein
MIAVDFSGCGGFGTLGSASACTFFAVDFSGEWWIGDFGSCVRIGAPIVSTTISCHPSGSGLLGSASLWEYDWYMLAVAVLHQLDRSFSPQSDGGGAAFDTAVRQRCSSVADPAFRGLLLSMLECKEPVFKCTEIEELASGVVVAASAPD